MPVEVLGLSELPGAGDRLVVVPDEKTARATVAERLRREDLNRVRGATLEEMGARISSGQTKELRLILKTDVQGSIAAVRQALERLSTPETQIRLIHSGTGAVTESDVMLAVASDAIVIGFNVRPGPGRAAPRRPGQRADTALRHHLPPHGGRGEGVARPARTDDPGRDRRHGGSARRLLARTQPEERGLLRDGWETDARRARTGHPRWRDGLRRRHRRAAPIQGRRARSRDRLRVRRLTRRVQRLPGKATSSSRTASSAPESRPRAESSDP